MRSKQKIIVVLGPTSSGKSDAAIRLAREFDCEIVSADSRQIYRGMDVGTGKIEGFFDQERKAFISEGIPHQLIDIRSPRTLFGAAQFRRLAERKIREIIRRRKLPIICGGTGFWIKAVVNGVDFPEVKPDPKLRKSLSKKSTADLFETLRKLDPERAASIDAKNKVRLIRAIEICRSLGQVPKPAENERNRNGWEFLQIGIAHPKEALDERIEKRLRQRFAAGMVEEVRRLHFEKGISWKRLEEIGLGYAWISRCLKGELPETELFAKTFQAEKDYAKRQMTWFKRDKRIVWLNSYPTIRQTVKSFIEEWP